jgi:hypothetical protein
VFEEGKSPPPVVRQDVGMLGGGQSPRGKGGIRGEERHALTAAERVWLTAAASPQPGDL